MNIGAIRKLSDAALDRELTEIVARDRKTTVTMLAYLAVFDSRRRYAPAGYPSMHAYCVESLHMSDDIAFKRIRVARIARRFPEILDRLSDGRLTLSAAVMLAPYLVQATVADLLEAATHKRNRQIQELLAERYPQPDMASYIRAMPVTPIVKQLAVRPVHVSHEVASDGPPEIIEGLPADSFVDATDGAVVENAPQLPAQPVHVPHEVAEARGKVTPLSARRYGVQFTIDQEANELLEHVQNLLGHEVPEVIWPPCS
jgi:hypothetical protein